MGGFELDQRSTCYRMRGIISVTLFLVSTVLRILSERKTEMKKNFLDEKFVNFKA